MPFWKRWRIFWFLWTAVWLALILLRPDYRTPVSHYITGEMYFPDSWPHSLTLAAVYAFLPLSSAFLSLFAFFRRHKAVFLADRRAAARRLSGAVRVGGHAQRQHRIRHGFIRRAAGLFGAICGASLFLCACQKYIMLRRISGAGCLPIRHLLT